MEKLPIELVARIFTLGALYDYPYRDSDSPFLLKSNQTVYPAIPSSNFQLKVSHVCCAWRALALDTPGLWTTVHFSSPHHLPRAIEYIARATANKRCPPQAIDILVDTVSPEEHIDGSTLCINQFDDVFEIILPHVDNWRAFHLKVRDDACKGRARYWLHRAPSALRLETLQLYHFENFNDHHDLHIATFRPPVVIFHNNCPRLVNVSLIGVNLNWAHTPFLRNLRHLELALHRATIRPPYSLFMKMLRESPGLRSLHLHYSGPQREGGGSNDFWGPVTENVRLPSLDHLMLTDVDLPSYLIPIIERLVLPELTKLSLNLPITDDGDWTSFINLIVHGRDITPRMLATLAEANAVAQTQAPPPTLGAAMFAGQQAAVQSGSPNSLPPSPTPSASPSQSPLLRSNALPSPATTSLRIDPVPELSSRLQELVVTGLECDLPSWRALITAVHALKVLEVDFERSGTTVDDIERRNVPAAGDGSVIEMDQEAPEDQGEDIVNEDEEIAEHDLREPLTGKRGFFGVLLEGEALADPLPVLRDADGANNVTSIVRRTPLLPCLRTVRFSGLSAPRIREFIRYREGDWVYVHSTPQADVESTSNVSSAPLTTPGNAPASPDAKSGLKSDPTKSSFALQHYCLRREPDNPGIEVLFAVGGCKLRDGRRIPVEDVDSDDDDDDDDDEDDEDSNDSIASDDSDSP